MKYLLKKGGMSEATKRNLVASLIGPILFIGFNILLLLNAFR